MPRVQTPQGVKEFSYTPGGMAAARQEAASQLALPQGRDVTAMGLGALEGGIRAGGTAAKLSGGNPWATGGAAIAGAIGGAMSKDNLSKQNQAVGDTIKAVGTTAEMLSSAFPKKPPIDADKLAKLGSKLHTTQDVDAIADWHKFSGER